jgi:hypothetical protein
MTLLRRRRDVAPPPLGVLRRRLSRPEGEGGERTRGEQYGEVAAVHGPQGTRGLAARSSRRGGLRVLGRFGHNSALRLSQQSRPLNSGSSRPAQLSDALPVRIASVVRFGPRPAPTPCEVTYAIRLARTGL